MLELQLEIEQINQADIAAISAQRLKHYNAVLKEQVKELQHEISEVSMIFMMRYNIEPNYRTSMMLPDFFILMLNKKIKETKNFCKIIEKDIVLYNDPKELKCWLKDYRLKPEANIFIDY